MLLNAVAWQRKKSMGSWGCWWWSCGGWGGTVDVAAVQCMGHRYDGTVRHSYRCVGKMWNSPFNRGDW